MKYKITTCSTADMPEAFFKGRDIAWVPFKILIDGKSYPDDLGKTIPYDELFRLIAGGAMPTTSQVNTEEYEAFWEPFLKEGMDILHIATSSGISGTYNSAVLAAEDLRERFPDRRIYVIDSLCASSGMGVLATMLADRRDEGMEIDELADYADGLRWKVNHWFTSTDLTSFFRGGRISRTSFMFGRMLNICPVMLVDDKGRLLPSENVRTKKKSLAGLLNHMKERAEDGLDYSGPCYISNSAVPEDAAWLKAEIEKTFPRMKEPVRVMSIGGVIGSHTGPGTVALFFIGKDRREA